MFEAVVVGAVCCATADRNHTNNPGGPLNTPRTATRLSCARRTVCRQPDRHPASGQLPSLKPSFRHVTSRDPEEDMAVPFSEPGPSPLPSSQPETNAVPDVRLPTGASAPNDSNPPVRRTRRSPTFTSTPATPAPQLLCPGCDRALAYRQTVISGIKPIERWDYFECRTCGSFVYRERTRKLRAVT